MRIDTNYPEKKYFQGRIIESDSQIVHKKTEQNEATRRFLRLLRRKKRALQTLDRLKWPLLLQVYYEGSNNPYDRIFLFTEQHKQTILRLLETLHKVSGQKVYRSFQARICDPSLSMIFMVFIFSNCS